MHIGEAARQSGVSAKMIRYYEQSGLIPPAVRRASGYRDYSAQDVHRLRFVRRARDLGFSVERIAELLSLWGDRERSSSDVHAITSTHIDQLRHKAQQIDRMIAVLEDLAQRCQHDDSPDCPILDELPAGCEVRRSDIGTTNSGRYGQLNGIENRRPGA